MTRPDLKDAVLEAAEAIVVESGAGHLTLDAVAERAGISKGGLMYNFRTKEALLDAMISRLIEQLDEVRDKVRRKLPAGSSALLVEIKTLMELSESNSRLSCAMVAVNAFQPGLLKRFRDDMQNRLLSEIAAPGDFERATALYFAAFGLHVHELLNVPILTRKQMKSVFKELMRMAGEDGKRPG